MRARLQKVLIISILAIALFVTHNQFTALAQNQSTAIPVSGFSSLNATPSELTQAGYSNARVESPQNGHFEGPTEYFRVKQKADPSQETSDLIVISRYHSQM